jgi:hypothetical protein
LYLCDISKSFPLQQTWSLGKTKKLQGTKSGKMGNHWVVGLGQKLTGSQGYWTWCTAVVQNLDTRRHLCDEILNNYGIREEIHDAPDPPYEGK